ALKEHPELCVRMGVHSGPVSGVVDLNDRANVAGAGINMAQRVMDCGDAGHILLSKHVAEDLQEYEHWRPLLHDLGACEVKHGVRLSLANLYMDDLGNAAWPKKFLTLKRRKARVRWATVTAALFVLAAIFVSFIVLLRRPVHQTLAAPEKSIAVLPFENLSSDKENAYFADGIQDDILTALSKISDLKVISRTSVMQYKGKAPNVREIGKALGVSTILEGSVRRSGNRVRLNVQLIDATNDEHLWASDYDRELTDVFAIQTDLAQNISDALQAKLSPAEKSRLERKPTENSDAYLAFVQAHNLVSTSLDSFETLKQAEHLYARAIELDPKFALA